MSDALFHVGIIDYIIIGAYFAFVIGIGFLLKNHMKTEGDFFVSGRTLPVWITGIAFLSANMGAIELLGMAGGAAEYGLLMAHNYYGAIPAMLFLGLFMMPFYYSTRILSIPEYLKRRYNEATRAVNAISFAVMTLLVSGISLYSMALIFKVLIGWSLTTSILFSAVIVLIYVTLGGLTSSIYNEVLQFFLIWIGLLPVPLLGLKEVGGFSSLKDRLPDNFTHLWADLGNTAGNPMAVDWMGIVLGLIFVLGFSFWTTDFVVVQRTFAARNLRSAQNTPILASFFKMIVPLITIVPGLIVLLLFPDIGKESGPSYNLAFPMLIQHYYPPGLLGLGLTGLLASFMSGMAGNVTAFTAIWTNDIYKAYINRKALDSHYVKIGRWTVVLGVLVSIGTSYIAASFPSIMDYLQLLFSFFTAPMFATFLLGMFWKRATPWGGFWGLTIGVASALLMFILMPSDFYGTDQARNFWQSWWAWAITMGVTIIISLLTKPKSNDQLKGLVYGLAEKPNYKGKPWFKRPGYLALVSILFTIGINILLW